MNETQDEVFFWSVRESEVVFLNGSAYGTWSGGTVLSFQDLPENSRGF